MDELIENAIYFLVGIKPLRYWYMFKPLFLVKKLSII